jgi:WD40 repeat protein
MTSIWIPSSLSIVAASDDKTARVWDAASGKETAVLRMDCIAWSRWC